MHLLTHERMSTRKLKTESRVIPSAIEEMEHLELSCFRWEYIWIQQIEKTAYQHLLKLNIHTILPRNSTPGIGSPKRNTSFPQFWVLEYLYALL